MNCASFLSRNDNLFCTLIILFVIVSSLLMIGFTSAQQPTAIFCGTNDQVIDDPELTITISSENSSTTTAFGSSEENPCPVLEIRNKNVKEIKFISPSQRLFVRKIVIRDSHVRRPLEIKGADIRFVSGSSSDASSTPSYAASTTITVNNVFFDWITTGGAVTSEQSVVLLDIIGLTLDKILISNCFFNVDSNFDPGPNHKMDTHIEAALGLYMRYLGLRDGFELINNTFETTARGFNVDENVVVDAGEIRIENNIVAYSDKYSTAVDQYGTFTYQRRRTELVHVASGQKQSSSSSSSTSLSASLTFYFIGNTIRRVSKFHHPRADSHILYFALDIFRGEIGLIENNTIVLDADERPVIAGSGEDDDDASGYSASSNLVIRILSWAGGTQGVGTRFSRFIIRNNRFFANAYSSVRCISFGNDLKSLSTCDADVPSSFIEISHNSFDVTTRTTSALNTNFDALTSNQRTIVLKNFGTSQLMWLTINNCNRINISNNIAHKIDNYKPVEYGAYDISKLQATGFPSVTSYAIDIGAIEGASELMISNNMIKNLRFEVDRSLLAIGSILLMGGRTTISSNNFSLTFRSLVIVGNTAEFARSSSSSSSSSSSFTNMISSFNTFSMMANLPFLDSILVENNTVDLSPIDTILPCELCRDATLLSQIQLVSLFDPIQGADLTRLLISLQTPAISLIFTAVSGENSSSAPLQFSVRSNVFTAPMPSSYQEANTISSVFFSHASPNPLSGTTTAAVAAAPPPRKKTLIFENNTFNVVSVHEEINYALPSSMLLLFSTLEFELVKIVNNTHIFENTDIGVAETFKFLKMNSSSSLLAECRGNRLLRTKTTRNNNNPLSLVVRPSFQRIIGFEYSDEFVIAPVWQEVSRSSSARPLSKMISFQESTRLSSSSSSSHQLLVSNNFIDMNNGTGESDNLMIHFNDSDSNFFDDVQIMNNNIHFSHDRAQTCSLITGLKTENAAGQLLKIENNQIDFAKCQKTSSILNATTIGGTVSLSNNKLNCGTQCLFASIDQIAPSSTLTMKSNLLSMDKETECDDEQRYLKLQQSSSTSSTSSSFKLDVSSDVFETNCNEITFTRNGEARILNVSSLKSIASVNDVNCEVLTKCQDERNDDSSKTKTLNEPPLLPSAAAIVVSDEVSAALTTNDAVQSFSMGALAIGAASTPTLGFSVARQQAMMNYAQNALKGDCRGLLPVTKTSGEEDSENENPLGAADSPTRMQIGDSVAGPYVGSVIGNFILFCGLILLNQLVGHLVTKIIIAKYFSVPSNMKLAFMFSKTKKKEYEQQQDRWKDPKYVFVNSFVSLSLFYLVALLLSPTLTSAVVVVAGVSNEIVPVGIKILCLILAFIIAGVGVYFIFWSTFIRKPRREEYRITNQEEVKEQNKKKEIGVLDLLKKYCKADGEWKIPINKRTPKENDEFQIAEPCFTSYRKNQWFAVVEVITSILLCLPPLFAQLGSSGKSSCVIHGSLLFVILLVYTILLIWKNPKKIPAMRIVFPMMAIQQTVTAGMTLIAVVTRDDDNENDQSMKAHEESWLWNTIFVPMGFSVFLGILAMLVSISPMLTFFYKLRQRLAKAQQQQNGRRSGEKHGSRREMNNSYNDNNDEDDLEMNLVERKNNNNNNNNNNHGDGRRRESRDDKHHHSHNGSRNDPRRHHDQRDHHSSSRKEHTTGSSSLSSPHRHHHHRRNDNNDDNHHHHRRRDHHSSLSNSSNHHRHHSSSSASRYHNDRDRQNHHNRRPSSSRNEEDRRNHRETRYHHHHHYHDRRSPVEGDRNKTEDRRREGDSSSRRREQHSNRHQDHHGQSRSSGVRRTSSFDRGRNHSKNDNNNNNNNNNSRDCRYRDKMSGDPLL